MKTSTANKVKIARLVEDLAIYPRHSVDGAHVSALEEAIRSGAHIPPVVVDDRTMRIVDGFHRCRALRRIYGDGAEIDAELVKYKTEKDVLADAIKRNTSHGLKLQRVDQTRCILMLRGVGATDEEIQRSLSVTQGRFKTLTLNVAKIECDGSSKSIAIKRCISHKRGNTLTAKQAEAHKRAPGVSYLLIATQLYDAMKEEMLDMENPRMVEKLKQIKEWLNENV